MQQACVMCGKEFTAKRKTARYCGATCRVRASRTGQNGQDPVVVVDLGPDSPAEPPENEHALVRACRAEIERSDRLDSVLGQQALGLAERIATARTETGSSYASLSREFRDVMAAVMAGVPLAGDPVDELRLRRESKLAG